MIFGPHGEALVLRIEARPLRHSPAHQHVPDLQAEIVVHGPSRVGLNHEPELPFLRAPTPGSGLGGAFEIAPLRVLLQLVHGDQVAMAAPSA